MTEDPAAADFDLQAAWLRRFQSDAESNLRAFALSLREAMPELVTLHQSSGLFARNARTTGVSVALGEHLYTLKIERGRLEASVALVVRGITLNTKSIDPAEWFQLLAAATLKASDHAKNFSQSLSRFIQGG